ncbi:ABC-type nitrate/sulfonate/bicarbonate transport system, substrate-binding protein [Arthrobacter sp. OV608]|jgi:NitT/TauT family transport system substrate-binding protein|nr:ABC-type nitrate/sulfonate/bicarbonate transport system, substrate-binding protein [Arthrobacter sp. OV608]
MNIRHNVLLRTVTATAAVALALTMAACGTNSAGSSAGGGDVANIPAGTDPHPLKESTKVTVAVTPSEQYMAFWVGKEKGEFQKENIDLQIQDTNPTQLLQSVLTGAADVTLATPAGLFNAIDGGGDLRIVSGAFGPDEGTGYYLSPALAKSKPDFGPCDMKGLNVTVAPGATIGAHAALPMSNYLAKCNLGFDDVKLGTTFGPDSLVALQSGALDVAMVYGSLGPQAAALGAKKIVPFTKDMQTPWVFGQKLRSNPEAAAAVLRALVRTHRTYLQGNYHDKPEVMKVLSQYLKLPEETIAKFPPVPFDPDLAFDPKSMVVDLQNLWLEKGGILSYKEPLTVDKVTDLSYLKRVLEQ